MRLATLLHLPQISKTALRLPVAVAALAAACLLAPCTAAGQSPDSPAQAASSPAQSTLPPAPAPQTAPVVTPPLTVQAPYVSTEPPQHRQPPIGQALSLPLAPPPEAASPRVTGALSATFAPRGGHAVAPGVYTPVATGQPLSLSLDDAVDLALQHNLTITTDQQRLRQVAGLRLGVLNALIPNLSVSGQHTAEEINLAAMGFKPQSLAGLLPPGTHISTIAKVNYSSAQINLSQQIFNLPAIEIYRASQAVTAQTNLETLLNRADIIQAVATQYLRTLSDKATLRNLQSLLLTDREIERQAVGRKEAGVGVNLDVLRATVDRQSREQQVIAAQNGLDKDRIRLNRLMGLAADQPLDLTDGVPYSDIDMLSLNTAMQVAMHRRKDLLALEQQLRSSGYQRKAVRYERLPAVAVSGYYGVIGQNGGPYHGDFVAQAGLNFPVFEEARIRGDRDVADAQISRIRNQIDSLRADILQQIRSSMLDVETARELVNDANSNVALATEQLSETEARYKAGVDDTLPVVRAQSTLAGAQAQLVSALFQFNTAKLTLARSTGVIESQYDTYLGR